MCWVLSGLKKSIPMKDLGEFFVGMFIHNRSRGEIIKIKVKK